MENTELSPTQQRQKILEQKFPKSQVLKRPGDGGKVFNYIEAASVAQRLNEVFGYRWSIEVVSEQIVDDEIVVKIQLKVNDGTQIHTKEAYGGTNRKRKRNGEGYANALADDLKAAQSDVTFPLSSSRGKLSSSYI